MTLTFTAPSIYQGMKSNTERLFADHLEVLRRAGQIVQWRYECTKFKVGGKAEHGKQAWYTPDFDAITCEGEKVFYEVKGSWDAKNQRDAKTRIKVCAEKYAEYTWYAVQKAKGRGSDWDFERFGA